MQEKTKNATQDQIEFWRVKVNTNRRLKVETET